MSLLSICQNVARAIPVEIPTVIVGSSNETSSLLLACAQQAGNSLYRQHNWLDLVTEYTFDTVASQADYDLPSDYGRLVNDTLWDRANYEQIRGPLTPQEWQEYKSSVLASTNTVWKRYRIRNVSGSRKFSIHPTPAAVEAQVFEYVSNNWCESSGGDGQSSWQADSDSCVLDEYLIELGVMWRALKRLGMEYGDERKEYETEVSKAIGRDGGAKRLNVAGRRRYHLIGPYNVPDSGYGV